MKRRKLQLRPETIRVLAVGLERVIGGAINTSISAAICKTATCWTACETCNTCTCTTGFD